MRRYTERQTFTVPADVKARLKRAAAARGITMSEHVRRMISDMIANRDFQVFMAELELKKATAH